ncbi:SKP1 component, dimerization [Pseudocohnilembus persalinus]|uniref:SKP1 component, dimerization n=1 Tax=Pseudocohnilembus persalinus TaxID=266149 RepID=A0A0V0QI55_PSEPJ|nr:SKP1 component, dimerization [Pseudocohnilembus persalinus]|eukprot:KRX01971.1 SKP1 component, dimerization [Pseudocohnilembus persalinus]
MQSPNIVLKSNQPNSQKSYSVPQDLAKKYLEVINNYDFEDQDSQEFELKLDEEQIELVLEFIQYHGLDNPPNPIPKPLPSSQLKLFVQEWDYNYITKLSQEELNNLMNTAHYLYCKEILELCSAYIASILLSNTLDELKETYNIQTELTPELEEQIKNDHKDTIFKGTQFEL